MNYRIVIEGDMTKVEALELARRLFPECTRTSEWSDGSVDIYAPEGDTTEEPKLRVEPVED